MSDVVITTTNYLSIPDEAQNIVAVSRTGGSVTLSWTPPFDFGGADITAYDVSFFLGTPIRSQFRQRVPGINPNATSVTAKVVGLLANSNYGFSVAGVNDVSVCEDPSVILTRTIVYSSTDPLVTLPDTPRGLTIAQSTSGMQMIQWSASEDTGGSYFVAYILYSNIGEILYNGTNTTFACGSLTKNTRYGYAVSAWNTVGTSDQSNLVFATTSAAIVTPSQPLGLTQTNSTGGSIGLSWQMPLDSGGEKLTGYKIYRNTIWRADVAADGSILSFLDDQGLVADQQYVYVVHATNSIGLGAMSDKLTASTSSATVPSPPSTVYATAIGGNLTATWVPASNTGGIPLTFFHIQVLIDSSVAFETTCASTLLSYTVYGVRAGTIYIARVTSKNQMGESLPITQNVTSGAALSPKAPHAPEQYLDSATLVPWTIRLKLYLPIDDGGAPISQLFVYQNGTKVASTSVDASYQAALGNPTTRFTLFDLGPLHAGTVYYFAVSAVSSVDTIGEGTRSSTTQVLTNPATLPSEPLNFAVGLRTSFSVFLKWEGPIDTGGDDVFYELSYINTNTSESLGVVTLTTTTVEVPKLIPGNIYLFQLRSRNSAGSSDWTAGLATQTDVTQRGIITYNLASSTVYENISSVTVDLLRVNGSAGTVTCSYTDGLGTAVYGQDYSLPPESERSFSFSGELTKQSFDVTIINDDKYEPNPRTVILTLADTTADRSEPISPTTIKISILDDGDAGTIGFAVNAVSVLENARVLSLSLQRLVGKSSATSVRVIAYNGLNSTTQPEVGFRLPSASIDFMDGQVQRDASIVIKDNDVYDFPYLYFYLTLEITAGKATIGQYSVIRVEVQDDGDRSAPGLMKAPMLTKATGGMLELAWIRPENLGGKNLWITGYNLLIRVGSSVKWLVTPTNVTALPYGGLNADTKHSFSIYAINAIGPGPSSPDVTFATTNFTAPGPPAQIDLVTQTGGLITVNISVPIDAGGSPITGYLIYISEQDEGYQVGKGREKW